MLSNFFFSCFCFQLELKINQKKEQLKINTEITITISKMLFLSKCIQNEKIVLVATLKVRVATCGDWQQGWTTLL